MSAAKAAAVRTTEYTRADFAALHFAPDPDHVGRAAVFGRGKGGQLYRIFYCAADELPEKLESFKLWNQDYYITANTFSGGERRAENLFTLQNIVIDVDCHAEGVSEVQRAHMIDAFEFFMLEDLEGPRPNTIVKTGRGVQLWYAIEPVSRWKAQQYESVRESLIEAVQRILDDQVALSGLELDRGATHNAAGVFRLPGSYNSKTGARGSFYQLHEERLDILEEAQRLAVEEIRKPQAKIYQIPEGGADSVAVAIFRQAKLGQLLTLRQQSGQQAGEELRDLFLFCLYNSWGRVCPDHEAIMERVESMNRRFLVPLPDRELRAYLRSSEKVRYKLSNQKIIDLLAITPEEQSAIGFYPGGSGQNNLREQQRQEARDRKAERDAKICELYIDGQNQKAIAAAVGCSEATVGRVLRREGHESRREKLHGQILQQLQNGHTAAEVAENVGVSVSAIYDHAKKARQNAPEGPQSDEAAQAGKISTEAENAAEGHSEGSLGGVFSAPSDRETGRGCQILKFKQISKTPLFKGAIYGAPSGGTVSMAMLNGGASGRGDPDSPWKG